MKQIQVFRLNMKKDEMYQKRKMMKKIILFLGIVVLSSISYGHTVKVHNKTDSKQSVAVWYIGRGVCLPDKWLDIPSGEPITKNVGACCLKKIARIENIYGDYYEAKEIMELGFGERCTSHVIEIQKNDDGSYKMVRLD